MGEMADAMIDGDACEQCGQFFDDDGRGYPRKCASCGGEDMNQSDHEDFVDDKQEFRSHEEPRRTKYALEQLKSYKVRQMGASRIDIYLPQGKISLYPFTGWFVGLKPLGKIKGRGIHELIKELEKIKCQDFQ